MRVIGTAGHVDHGKSTLVHCLTGMDPDRLAEEKAREMTIDLGFAWFTLPGGEAVSLVDVPGHRDFIENMLAGVGGVDAVLLVIAADEGVMPQTREHLAILDLLGLKNGLVVLSKIDLIDDPDWLQLVEHEIRDVIRTTVLEDAPIVPVSAYSRAGIDQLIRHLEILFVDLPPRVDNHIPRLPIDRVFTISGFGTVVTGTLSGGSLHMGDEVEIQPVRRRGRIRTLQSHNQVIEQARPGNRVAVNISGIDKHEISRGMVLGFPKQLSSTLLIDVFFRHLAAASRPIKHNSTIKFFSGAAETTGFVRLLANSMLMPGEEGWLQIRLENAITLAEGDRYILRYPSPAETIGGGVVINPQPRRRWKRNQPELIQRLETRMFGTPEQRLLAVLVEIEPASQHTIASHMEWQQQDVNSILETMHLAHQVLAIEDGSYITARTAENVAAQVLEVLRDFHTTHPLRGGLSRAEVKSRLRLKNGILNFVIADHDMIVSDGHTLRLATHTIRFSEDQQKKIDIVMDMLIGNPYSPPGMGELLRAIGHESLLHALVEVGEIVQVQPEIFFARQSYETMVSGTLELIDEHGAVTAAILRDNYQTTRKYAIALLEHLDNLGVTRRVGDERVRGDLSN